MPPNTIHAPISMVGTPDLSGLATMVTVRDICSPFIGTFDSLRSASEVGDEWSLELCPDSSPLDHIGLVLQDGKPAGILHYADLQSDKSVSDCITPFPLDALITKETSLITVAGMFTTRDVPFFVVIKGNDFVGWISYHDLDRLPFRLCLFAAVLGIEEKMLRVVLRDPKLALGKLSSKQRDSARRLYQKHHADHRHTLHDEPWDGIVGCTYFRDKASMLQQCAQTRSLIPAVCEKKWIILLNKVRNALAHPDPSKHFAVIVDRERFAGFMAWLGRIDAELSDFLDSGSPLEVS
jgi:hypothetical protein